MSARLTPAQVRAALIGAKFHSPTQAVIDGFVTTVKRRLAADATATTVTDPLGQVHAVIKDGVHLYFIDGDGTVTQYGLDGYDVASYQPRGLTTTVAPV